MTRPTYLPFMDDYRAIAIIGIVGWHMLYTVRGSLVYSRGALGAIMEAGTMMFVLISGFLFEYLRRQPFQYRPYLLAKLQNIVMPYCIASALLIALRLWKQNGLAFDSFLRQWGNSLLDGSASPVLWFIPMIVIFYLFSPVLIRLSEMKIFRFAPLLLVIPLIIGRGKYTELVRNIVYFFPFYLSGMALAHDYPLWSKKLHQNRYLWGMSMISLLVCCGFFPDCAWLQNITKMMVAFSVFFFCEQIGVGKRLHGMLQHVAVCGMGIYLYHNSVIGIFGERIWKKIDGNEGLAIVYCLVGTIVCVTVLVTGLLTGRWMLRKIGIKQSRMLIGVNS